MFGYKEYDPFVTTNQAMQKWTYAMKNTLDDKQVTVNMGGAKVSGQQEMLCFHSSRTLFLDRSCLFQPVSSIYLEPCELVRAA